MPAKSTTVLNHFIAIMDCFTLEHPELGVRAVARMINLSPSTTGRLMIEMKDAGILQQPTGSKLYSPGWKVLTWSSVYNALLNIRSIALPMMEELRRATGETVTLYIRDGKERLCVERMESQNNIRMVTRVGTKLPLYVGSAGKAILAYMPLEEQEDYLRNVAFNPLTNQTIADPDVLREELAKIRKQGYAVSMGEWLLEAAGVAAPILGPGGAIAGALSISGPIQRFTEERIGEYTREIIRYTRLASQSMGYIQPY